MRISIKAFALSWVVLLIIIGLLLYNAYSKFRPDSFTALISEQVQKNYPGAKFNIGAVSYKFSLDFNLNLQKLTLHRKDKVIASVEEIEFRVPWWLLLANKGNAHVNIKNVEIFVDHRQNEKLSSNNVTQSSDLNEIKFTLPKYLADATYTLRAFDVFILDLYTGEKYLTLSKLLVREFQYGKNSAFEINIPLSVSHKNTPHHYDLWVFGDLTPQSTEWILNFRGKFSAKESLDRLQVEDLMIAGRAKFLTKKLELNSKLNFSVDKLPSADANLNVDTSEMGLDVKINSLPLSYFEFLFKNEISSYLANTDGNVKGTISFKKSLSSKIGFLQSGLDFDQDFYLSQDHKFPGTWKVNVSGNQCNLLFSSSDGRIKYANKFSFSFDENKPTQQLEEIEINDVDLPIAQTSTFSLPTLFQKPENINFKTFLNLKNSRHQDQIFNGSFTYGIIDGKKFYKTDLIGKKSYLKLNFQNASDENLLSLDVKNFRWFPTLNLLSPISGSYDGFLDGKVQAKWNNSWDTGLWSIQLKGENLLASNGKMSDILNKTLDIFDLKIREFKSQKLHLKGSKGDFSLNSLVFEGKEKFNLNGFLSRTKKSSLTLFYTKDLKVIKLKKDITNPYWLEKDEN